MARMSKVICSVFTRFDFKDPILGSENWKQAFKTVRFQGSVFVVRMSEGEVIALSLLIPKI